MIEVLLECDVDTKKINICGLTALNVLESHSRSDNRDISLNILHDYDQRGLKRLKALLIPRAQPLY